MGEGYPAGPGSEGSNAVIVFRKKVDSLLVVFEADKGAVGTCRKMWLENYKGDPRTPEESHGFSCRNSSLSLFDFGEALLTFVPEAH